MEQKWRLQKQTKFSLQCQNAGNGFLEFKILLGQFTPIQTFAPQTPPFPPRFIINLPMPTNISRQVVWKKQPVDLEECCEWYG